MVIRFDNCELKLDEIRKDEIPKEHLLEHELVVIHYVKQWLGGTTTFSFQTSGSTGKPKTIQISREKIAYSCQSTMEAIDPHKQFQSTLLCLNPEMIGGAMVVFRALIRHLNLRVIQAQANPFEHLKPNEQYDLVSLVPLQLQGIDGSELDHFHSVLVGGAHWADEQVETKANIYKTFGMTETVSHFALQSLKTDYYQCIGDATIVARDDQKLSFYGTITNGAVLVTNDLIERIDHKRFRWLGRADFVINTGGVKVSPETIEQKLTSQLKDARFIVTSIPDDRLGERVVLLIEGEERSHLLSFDNLDRYERPKEIRFLPTFEYTASGKISRPGTQERLLQSLNE